MKIIATDEQRQSMQIQISLLLLGMASDNMTQNQRTSKVDNSTENDHSLTMFGWSSNNRTLAQMLAS